MSGPRRWLCAGAALVVAGGLTAVSTWRHWAVCRVDLGSAACRALQDATHGFPGWGADQAPDPVASGTAMAAAVLLSTVWVLVVGCSRTSLPRTLMCVVVGAQPLVAALVVTLEAAGHPPPAGVGEWLTWPAETYVFPLLLGAGWLLTETALTTVRLLFLGWGVTSFGSVHRFADYAITQAAHPGTAGLSPPGLGYVTAVTQLVLGLVVILLTLPHGSTDAPDPPDRPDHDDFTLAA
jgi:hypothetical protein